MNIRKRGLYYLGYTVIFSLIIGFVLYFFNSQGNTLIDFGGDGLRQHYRSLLYYSNYLKELFANILRGKFVIPQWDFVIGQGADILNTFHYYCIGDIFTFFSFLCPEKYMYLYYEFITILRMYFAGIAFSELCFYKKKTNYPIILASSLIYAFMPFNFYNMMGHVFFISASVYFPLIILGIEKILNDDSKLLFVLAVMLSATSNIYFFFINVVSTIIYVVVRLLFSENDIKNKIKYFVDITLYSLLGVSMACIIFLPVLKTMLFNARLESKVVIDLFYSIDEYLSMFKSISFGHYNYFGDYSILWSLASIYLFKNSKNKTLITLLLISMIFIVSPLIGSIFNLMASRNDRFIYTFTLLYMYIFTEAFEDIKELDKNFYLNLIVVVLYYFACIFIDKENLKIFALFFIFSIIVLLSIKYIKIKNLSSYICLSLVVLTLLIKVLFDCSPNYWGYSKSGTSYKYLESMSRNDEYSIFDSIQDDSFFRYSGNQLRTNQAILGKHSSIQYYWSVVENSVVDFREKLAISDRSLHQQNNYDDRFTLNILAGVKYYINENNYDERLLVPSSYEFIKVINGYDVYKTPLSLPLVFAYDNYYLYDDFIKLKPEERNAALLQTAILKHDVNEVAKLDNLYNDYINIDFQATYNDVVNNNTSLIFNNSDSSVNLKCDSKEKGEYYLVFEELYSDLDSNIQISYDGLNKYISYKNDKNPHNTNRHNFIVNLGYMEEIKGDIVINVSAIGEYKVGDIRLICQPLDYQRQCIQKLNIPINSLDIGINNVKANITLNNNKVVCFSIPYSAGWKVYVNNEKVELLNVDAQYMGVSLNKGTYDIELRYETPLLKVGALISIISTGLFVYLFVKERKH